MTSNLPLTPDQWLERKNEYKAQLNAYNRKIHAELYSANKIEYSSESVTEQMWFRKLRRLSQYCYKQYCHCDICEYVKKHESKYLEIPMRESMYNYLYTNQIKEFKSLLPNRLKRAIKQRKKARIVRYYKAKETMLDELDMHPVFVNRRMIDDEDECFEHYGY